MKGEEVVSVPKKEVFVFSRMFFGRGSEASNRAAGMSEKATPGGNEVPLSRVKGVGVVTDEI